MESTPSLSPISALQHSISAVPQVKYALGLTGVAAAVAIILGFVSDIRIAVFGVLIALALMYLLAIFTQVLANIPGLRWLAGLLVWTITILFLSALVMVLTSYAFGKPEILANRLFNAAVTHREVGGANVDVGLFESLGPKFVEDSDNQSEAVAVENNQASESALNYCEGNVLRYTYDRLNDSRVQIKPDMPYLSLLRQPGPITNFPSCPFTFPKLSVKAVNNTDRTLVISEVAIDIKSSSTINIPMLRVSGDSEHPTKQLYFYNEGWQDLLTPVVEYDVTDTRSCKNVNFANTKYTTQLPTIQDTTSIDISQAILDFENRTQKSARYPDGQFVCAFGRVNYRTTGPTRTVTFRTSVAVQELPGLSTLSPAIYGVALEAGKQGYTKWLSVYHELKPGQSDLFLLSVKADRWAQFDLHFSFRTTEGNYLPGNDLFLEVFVPRFIRSGLLIKDSFKER